MEEIYGIIIGFPQGNCFWDEISDCHGHGACGRTDNSHGADGRRGCGQFFKAPGRVSCNLAVRDWKGLVFADLRGGTPYNQAELLLAKHGLKDRAKVISGMNLPMVVDAVLSDMDVCSTDALAGLVQNARDGIMCLDLEAQTAGSDDE